MYNISDEFTYTSVSKTINIPNNPNDYVLTYIEYLANFYRITFIFHRVSGSVTLTIPANSYYFDGPAGNLDADTMPTLVFYEGDQVILQVNAPSTPTTDGNAQIITSSLITQFVFTSN